MKRKREKARRHAWVNDSPLADSSSDIDLELASELSSSPSNSETPVETEPLDFLPFLRYLGGSSLCPITTSASSRIKFSIIRAKIEFRREPAYSDIYSRFWRYLPQTLPIKIWNWRSKLGAPLLNNWLVEFVWIELPKQREQLCCHHWSNLDYFQNCVMNTATKLIQVYTGFPTCTHVGSAWLHFSHIFHWLKKKSRNQKPQRRKRKALAHFYEAC